MSRFNRTGQDYLVTNKQTGDRVIAEAVKISTDLTPGQLIGGAIATGGLITIADALCGPEIKTVYEDDHGRIFEGKDPIPKA